MRPSSPRSCGKLGLGEACGVGSCQVDLQCCISFWCTTKWFSYVYIHTHILLHYGLLQDIECIDINSSCAVQSDLAVYFIYSSLYLLISRSLFITPSLPLPLGNCRSVLCVYEYVSVS